MGGRKRLGEKEWRCIPAHGEEGERERKSEDPWMARVVLSRCARILSSLQPSSPPFALRIRSLKVVRCADSALDGRRVERDEIIDFVIFQSVSFIKISSNSTSREVQVRIEILVMIA